MRRLAGTARQRTPGVMWSAGLIALLLTGGCASTVTPIRMLLDDARRFNGEDVRIVGNVESPVGVLGFGTFQVNDGTGTLRVVSQSGGAPRAGARVGVKGTFRSAFVIGSESLATVVEEARFQPSAPRGQDR